MRVVIAPDSFKDALTAEDVVFHIARGLHSFSPDIELDFCPVSDGGEGFTSVLGYRNPSAVYEPCQVNDPLGRIINAGFCLIMDEEGNPDTAAIELATASGLERLKPEERDPTVTTTVGTGEIIRYATESIGVKRILLGIGGSATNDAGTGIVQALGKGLRYTPHSREPHIYIKGRDLVNISEIEPGPAPHLPEGTEIRVACDVTNPLTGPSGAAHVYSPQKGAKPEQVELLDAGLRHIAQLWRDQLGIDVENMPGAGAAGGVGGGLVAMLGAKLVPGAELVLDTIGFDERIKDADLVITGEGRLDSQSLQGKAAMAVAKRAAKAGVPCYALVGSVGEGADETLKHGLTGYRVIGEGLAPEESIRRTGELLEKAAALIAREHLR